MKFNHIGITDIKDDRIEFYPPDITSVKIQDEKILIMKSDGQLSPTKTITLHRDNYHYPSWSYFVEQLNFYFEL